MNQTHIKLLSVFFYNTPGDVVRVLKDDGDCLYFFDGRGSYAAVSKDFEGERWEWADPPLGDQLLKDDE